MKARLFYSLLSAPLVVLALTLFVIFQKTLLTGNWLITLLAVNFILTIIILAGIIVAAARFWRRWRRREAGSRLASRLAGLFLGMAFLPAIALYFIAVGGVFQGIESWFSTPLGQALEKGLSFGQSVLKQEFDRLQVDARNLAVVIDSRQSLPFWQEDLRLLYQVENITIYDAEGIPVVSALNEPALPLDSAALKRIQRNQSYVKLSDTPPRNLEVALPLPQQRSGFAIKVSRALPDELDIGLAEVEKGREEYEKLLFLRRGLFYSFMAVLSLSLVIVLAVSLWASARLGAHLFRPLNKMSKAALAVGRGDFSYRLSVGDSNDEIAQLSRAFNMMVGDLQKNRIEISERQAVLTQTTLYLENLLSSLTSGVLVFDVDGRLVRFNEIAENMLATPLSPLKNERFNQWTTLPNVVEMLKTFVDGDKDSVEDRLTLADHTTLVARMRRLPLSGGGGILMMVDDISRQIRAERENVWEEASQRFAHEIKNPLTPIQLASDRLKKKLINKLEDEDRNMLLRLSHTITEQVNAMRDMVDAFRLYADEQSRRHNLLNLNEIALEVTPLYEIPSLTLRTRCADNLPMIRGDAVLLRQVLHNLLGNACEAARQSESPQVALETVYDNGQIILTIEDNGGGIAPKMLDNLFTPYQTTKEKGSGLGLVIVRKIIEKHQAQVYLENIDGGARATLIFSTDKVSD